MSDRVGVTGRISGGLALSRRSSARPLAAAVLLAVLAFTARARAGDADADPWLGTDKALHFGATTSLAIGGYALGAALFESKGAGLLMGGGVAVTVSVGKELIDLAGAGHPSWKDLAWDGLGTVTGLAVAIGVHVLIEAVSKPSRPPPPTLAPSGAVSVEGRGLVVRF